MPRKRMIDPEFWSDEEIGMWSFQARLFYIGLWNFADDEGRMKAHPALLKSQIFPYENKINIEKLKNEVSSKVQWYTLNGQLYGHIRNFLKYQKIEKPSKSKLPIPPPFPDTSGSVRGEVVPKRSEEKLREVKRKEEKERRLDFVFLAPTEFSKLKETYGSIIDKYIINLNGHIGSKGDKYKSHYHTILNWLRRDNISPISTKKYIPPQAEPDPVEKAKVSALISKTAAEMAVK